MTLLEKITEDYKQAMKDHEEVKKLALNYLLAQIKNKKIELRSDPTDDDIIAVISLDGNIINDTAKLKKENYPKKIGDFEKEQTTIENISKETLNWMDENQNATKEECEVKLKEFEGKIQLILADTSLFRWSDNKKKSFCFAISDKCRNFAPLFLQHNGN